MSKHNVVTFPHPQTNRTDPLTEVLRQGAQKLLVQAIEAEVETYCRPMLMHGTSMGDKPW